jgi:EmrB/QacA subfamily drug resistance transporter
LLMPKDSSPTPAIARLVLVATILGSSMAFLDGTVVNLALPTLQKEFHANVSGAQWVVEAYALTLASLLLVGGSLGDRYGRRRVYVYGIVLFAASSIACGLASSMGWLIAARAIQGVGAALLVPGSLALITSIFPESERGRAIGTWSGFSAITAAIGPILGGWLIEHFSWRWVFFLNIPLAVAVVVLSMKIPEARDEGVDGGLDWKGALLTTVGLGGITYALIEWPSGFNHVLLGMTALAGVLALAALGYVEEHASSPMIPFGLFRSRDFLGANLLTFFVYAPLGALMFFTPLDLIQVQHYSATEAGAAFSPFILTMLLLSRWAGRLVERFGPRLPLSIGPFLTSLGFALFAMAPQNGNYWTSFFPAVLVMSLGMAITVAPLTTTVMNAVPQSNAGVASGINNAVSRLASLIAIAGFGAFLVVVFVHTLDRELASLNLPADVLTQIKANRLQLAGMVVNESRAMHAISTAFIHAYRSVIWAGSASLLAGACFGWFIVTPGQGRSASRMRRLDSVRPTTKSSAS